jgi:hypothetical protein
MSRPIRDIQLYQTLDAMEEGLKRPGGWIQGRTHNDSGGACLLGWAALALVGDFNRGIRYEKVRQALLAELSTTDNVNKCTVSGFNDHPGTKLEDVIAIVRRAREKLIST